MVYQAFVLLIFSTKINCFFKSPSVIFIWSATFHLTKAPELVVTNAVSNNKMPL